MKRLKELALATHHNVIDLRKTAGWSLICGIYVYAIVAFCT